MATKDTLCSTHNGFVLLVELVERVVEVEHASGIGSAHGDVGVHGVRGTAAREPHPKNSARFGGARGFRSREGLLGVTSAAGQGEHRGRGSHAQETTPGQRTTPFDRVPGLPLPSVVVRSRMWIGFCAHISSLLRHDVVRLLASARWVERAGRNRTRGACGKGISSYGILRRQPIHRERIKPTG